MHSLRNTFIACIAALTLSGFAHGQAGGGAPSGVAVSRSATELAEGEVRKVDKENKKVTLRHGPLKNLDMPGMTMVFHVSEDAMLDRVQPGDKVRFMAEKVDGKYTVTRIEVAR